MKNIILFAAVAMAIVVTPSYTEAKAPKKEDNKKSGLDRAKDIFTSGTFINEVVAIKFKNKKYNVRLINNPEGKPMKAGFLTICSNFIIAPETSLPEELVDQLEEITGHVGLSYLDAEFNGKRPFDLLANAS